MSLIKKIKCMYFVTFRGPELTSSRSLAGVHHAARHLEGHLGAAGLGLRAGQRRPAHGDDDDVGVHRRRHLARPRPRVRRPPGAQVLPGQRRRHRDRGRRRRPGWQFNRLNLGPKLGTKLMPIFCAHSILYSDSLTRLVNNSIYIGLGTVGSCFGLEGQNCSCNSAQASSINQKQLSEKHLPNQYI